MKERFSVLERIDKWVSLAWLSQLDRAFVRFLQDQDPKASHLVLWAGALVSHQLGRGEVFLDIEKLCQRPRIVLAIPDIDTSQSDTKESLTELFEVDIYKLDVWKKALNQSSLVSKGEGNTPLVFDGKHLYLRRYWRCQQILNSSIQQRIEPNRASLPSALQQQIAYLFPDDSVSKPDWQKIACVLALRARFLIITGGPGTGKTTTLTKLLTLLIHLSIIESTTGHKPNIILAAPTGKAAARVSESIVNALKDLPISDEIKQHIPTKAFTLHRLLGCRHNKRRYLHNSNNLLVADIVVVDEASMIDLEIMASLVVALPSTAKLILLGDKDQLSSVEAGSVLGDLCHGSENAAYDDQTRLWLKHYANEELRETNLIGSGINQQTVMLRHSHRFNEHSGIGHLAKAVNAGNAARAQAILTDTESYPDINCLQVNSPMDCHLKALLTAASNQMNHDKSPGRYGYGHYLEVIHQQRPSGSSQYDNWAKVVLEAFDYFRVLSVLRQGPWGVETLNQYTAEWLFAESKTALWYEGRPVMMTRNDYNLGLMNGDIGIALYGQNGKLQVAFPNGDAQDEKKILWISPMRLPDVETAFVMTAHKSQGSEFNHVALILPETNNAVLSKELIYTAITRAKCAFTLVNSHAEVFTNAILISCK